jgi:hypothetical protein
LPSNFKQISESLKTMSGTKKNCFTKINNKPPCIFFMNSHLILSLKPTCFTSFLSQIFGGSLYMELWESLVLPRYYSWDIINTRQDSHGLTNTHQKGYWKIMFRGGGREKHTLFRLVDMCKWQRVTPTHKRSPRYRIAHGLERWVCVLI